MGVGSRSRRGNRKGGIEIKLGSEREGGRETERETDRQRQKQRKRKRDRQTERDRNRRRKSDRRTNRDGETETERLLLLKISENQYSTSCRENFVPMNERHIQYGVSQVSIS